MAQTKERNEWVDWGRAIFIAILLSFTFKAFVFSTSIVEGESMQPTLNDGNRLLFNKLIYLIEDPNRGDVVIIETSFKNYVKRIIALPGEIIEMKNQTLYINGKVYEQLYLTEEDKQLTGNFGPIEVPMDGYFVMGDNRADSLDSRNGLGFINETDIIGRSEFIFYPYNDWRMTR